MFECHFNGCNFCNVVLIFCAIISLFEAIATWLFSSTNRISEEGLGMLAFMLSTMLSRFIATPASPMP
ncbi:MAG: hypothetical protein ACTTIZ_08590 [Treponema sp.]